MTHRHQDARRDPPRDNAGKPWDDAQDKNLRWLIDCGNTVAQIAETMQRTQAGIVARCERHGWKVQP